MNGQAIQLQTNIAKTDLDIFKELFTGSYGTQFIGAMKDNKIIPFANRDIFLNHKSQDHNRFFTLNSFRWQVENGKVIRPRKTKKNLAMVNALWVDLDCYSMSLSKQQVLCGLNDVLDEQSIPEPTCIVDSGNGLYLIWKIHSEWVNSPKFLKSYEFIQKELTTRLEEFGADHKSHEATHFLRVPNTLNIKRNKTNEVKILEIHQDRIYSMWDFYEYLTGISEEEYRERNLEVKEKREKEKAKRRKKKKKAKSKVTHLLNRYSYRETLKGDLEQLIILREGNTEGYREMILFLYANAMRTNNESNILERLMIVNYTFSTPLEQAEVEKVATQMTEIEAPYKYKNSTIIDCLNITEEEQQELKLLIGKAERVRRQREADAKRYEPIKKQNQQEKIKRNQWVLSLKEQGYSRSQIVKETGVSESTVKRILRASKK